MAFSARFCNLRGPQIADCCGLPPVDDPVVTGECCICMRSESARVFRPCATCKLTVCMECAEKTLSCCPVCDREDLTKSTECDSCLGLVKNALCVSHAVGVRVCYNCFLTMVCPCKTCGADTALGVTEDSIDTVRSAAVFCSACKEIICEQCGDGAAYACCGVKVCGSAECVCPCCAFRGCEKLCHGHLEECTAVDYEDADLFWGPHPWPRCCCGDGMLYISRLSSSVTLF